MVIGTGLGRFDVRVASLWRPSPISLLQSGKDIIGVVCMEYKALRGSLVCQSSFPSSEGDPPRDPPWLGTSPSLERDDPPQ